MGRARGKSPSRLEIPDQELRDEEKTNEQIFQSFYSVLRATFAVIRECLFKESTVKPSSQSAAVDPGAVKLLRGMTDHLSGLKQFSVLALNMREDVLESGHRVDFEVSAKVTVSRPNKLQANARAIWSTRIFYYDGKTLTLYNAVRQGLRDAACTRDDRGDARFRARVARARPTRSPTWSAPTSSRC